MLKRNVPLGTRGNFLKSGGLAVAGLALIPLSDCSSNSVGPDSLNNAITPPTLFAKPPFKSVWQPDGAYSFVDANGRSVVTLRRVSTSSVLGTSSFTKPLSIEVPQVIAIGTKADVGSGITVYRSAEHVYSWTGLDGNEGTYTRQGDQAQVYLARFAQSAGHRSPIAISIPNSPGRTPEDVVDCALAVAGLAAASLALGAALGAAGLQLGLDPFSDGAVYLAFVGYGIAFASYERACL